MVRRLGGGMKKYRRVFRGRGRRGRNGIVREWKTVNSNTRGMHRGVKRKVAKPKQKVDDELYERRN